MKITHIRTHGLSTPADNPLVVGLPAPADTRFVAPRRKGLRLGTQGGAVLGVRLSAEGGWRSRDDR